MAPEWRRAAAAPVCCLIATGALTAIPAPARAQSVAAAPDTSGETISAASPAVTNPLGAAPTVLPQIGSAVPSSISLQPGFAPADLSDQLDSLALGIPPSRQTGWTFSPSIGLTQEYDGGGAGGGGSQSVFITSIEPAISVSGTTNHVQADLYYAPVARIYEGGNSSSGDDLLALGFGCLPRDLRKGVQTIMGGAALAGGGMALMQYAVSPSLLFFAAGLVGLACASRPRVEQETGDGFVQTVSRARL